MDYCQRIITAIKQQDSNQSEFIQAVTEVLQSLPEVFKLHPEYESQQILERLVQPRRIIQFAVTWKDDAGKYQVNRGYRVQFNNTLGPFKGGLRFHPAVNLSILKFLAFEQTLKNALTTLDIGGAKGGSDFDPKGKSEAEIESFCLAFINELAKYIGAEIDVPAGDMGVGAKEIDFFSKQYAAITGSDELGVFTGKGIINGGSLVRKEATGYGLIYLVEALAEANDIDLKGKRAIISGSGNVALYAFEKAEAIGLQVVGISDSQGYLLADDLNLNHLKELKEVRKEQLSSYLERYPTTKYQLGSIYDAKWKAEIILPCAKENEIDEAKAKKLVTNGAVIVAEGANMPTNNAAIEVLQKAGVFFLPGKAANAGGVATSVLEMQQNKLRERWLFEEVDNKLRTIMENIHQQLIQTMNRYQLSNHDYLKAANIAAFERVANAMLDKESA